MYRKLLTLRARGDAHHGGSFGNRACDTRTGAHDRVCTDSEGLLRGPINDRGAGPDVRTPVYVDPAGYVHAWCQGHVVLQDHVVPNGAVQIDMDMIAEANVGGEDASRADNYAVTDAHPPRYFDTWVKKCREMPAGVRRPRDQSFPVAGGADGDRHRSAGAQAGGRIQAGHRDIVDESALGSRIVIDEALDDRPGRRDGFRQPRHFPPEAPSSPDREFLNLR